MTPAFGPLIAVLGALGLANAWRAWRDPDVGFSGSWAIDGALKSGFAAAMLGMVWALP